jgi:hypothetical protein
MVDNNDTPVWLRFFLGQLIDDGRGALAPKFNIDCVLQSEPMDFVRLQENIEGLIVHWQASAFESKAPAHLGRGCNMAEDDKRGKEHESIYQERAKTTGNQMSVTKSGRGRPQSEEAGRWSHGGSSRKRTDKAGELRQSGCSGFNRKMSSESMSSTESEISEVDGGNSNGSSSGGQILSFAASSRENKKQGNNQSDQDNKSKTVGAGSK